MKLKFWERFKGFFVSGATAQRKRKFWVGEKTWHDRCKYYDNIYERHPLAKAQILTIAGQLMAEGIFVQEADVTDPHKARAAEAKERCDQLNKEIGLDVMLYETAVGMPKYGSCFWEKTWTPSFDVRLLPSQELIEPAEQNEIGEITRWRQVSWTKPQPSWTSDELVHFPWNVTSKSWPYGTSLFVGLATEFEILEQLESDIKEFMEKQAFPKELYQVGDENWQPTDTDLSDIKSKVKRWKPGEAFVTNATVDFKAGGAGEHPIANLNDILNFLKEQCIDGLMVPPISKQWSSTMASAKEMMPWARTNLITPMQRIISRVIEHEIYQPYLQDLGYSVKVCPSLKFEPPDAHMDERAELYATLVGSGIIPPEIAAEELGYDLDKIKKLHEERMRREAEQQQLTKVQPTRREEEERVPPT